MKRFLILMVFLGACSLRSPNPEMLEIPVCVNWCVDACTEYIHEKYEQICSSKEA